MPKSTVVLSLVPDPLGLGWPTPSIENWALDGRIPYGLWDAQLLQLAATRVAAITRLTAAGCTCIVRDKTERGGTGLDDGDKWMARNAFVERGP